jgi:hypothetical protein
MNRKLGLTPNEILETFRLARSALTRNEAIMKTRARLGLKSYSDVNGYKMIEQLMQERRLCRANPGFGDNLLVAVGNVDPALLEEESFAPFPKRDRTKRSDVPAGETPRPSTPEAPAPRFNSRVVISARSPGALTALVHLLSSLKPEHFDWMVQSSHGDVQGLVDE